MTLEAEYTVELSGSNLYLVKDGGFRRMVGRLTEIKGKRVFLCRRDSSKHFFRKTRSWNLSEDVVCWLALHLVEEIHFITKKHIIKSTVLDWQQHGVRYKHEDYEQQLGLALPFFNHTKRLVKPRTRKGAI